MLPLINGLIDICTVFHSPDIICSYFYAFMLDNAATKNKKQQGLSFHLWAKDHKS